MVLFWVRAFQAEVRPSALRCKWTLHVQGTARGHVWLEHGRKVERERSAVHQRCQSTRSARAQQAFAFIGMRREITGVFKQRGMPRSDWHFIYLFWPHHASCGILVSQPGIEPAPPAMEKWSLNHWTTREDLALSFMKTTAAVELRTDSKVING